MNVSLYIHVPLCRRRCDYCDFFTRTGLSPSVQTALVMRTIEQWEYYRRRYGVDRLESIYVGGGTPSALDDDARYRLLRFLRSLRDNADVTVEVNPEDVTPTLLRDLEDSGVNRLSLGVQSLRRSSLDAIGRHTTVEDTRRGLELVAAHWRHSWNADGIVAVPGQSYRDATTDIAEIISFGPDHLSLYELDIVPTTRLGLAAARHRIPEPRDDQAERIVIGCGDLLESEGYGQYEVSNFARPGHRSRHNLRYWRMEPYLGLGPGAVGTLPAVSDRGLPERHEGTRDFRRFRMEPDFGVSRQEISSSDFCRDVIMMAFRTTEGIDAARFFRMFGYRLADAIPRTLDRWSRYLERREERVAPNRMGLRVVNAIVRDAFVELDGNPPPAAFPDWPV